MIDIKHAKKAFQDYVANYDIKIDEIRLKIVHTYAVMDLTDYICDKRSVSEEDKKLGELIALLHDIGRFEQFKRYGSYVDYKTIDHAMLGSDILFREGHIRDYITDEKYDKIIKNAIEQHNKFKVDDGFDERTSFFISLIRDADKLDNFRVKETEKVETLTHARYEDILNETITDKVYEDFKKHKLIYGPDRRTHLDMWVSLVAFIFDFNFPESKQYVKEHDYINRSFDRLRPNDAKTRERYEELRRVAQEYIDE